MKRCGRHRAAHRFVDGRLSGRESEAFETHLSECDACGKMVEELRSLAAVFERARRVRPAPALMERVRSETAARRIAAGGVAVVIMCRRLIAAAACISIVFSGMIYYHLSGGAINGEAGSGGSQYGAALKKGQDYYPFTILSESEKAFLSEDASRAFDRLYKMPEKLL